MNLAWIKKQGFQSVNRSLA
ncbi:hypothetical protein S40285_10916 [Stachybotrys chlorohalonatus IBT 40285]|uniref:Uncharacterized protein n=1 Tax=Stachybotrys chlorohalonatus (strain IBT 40285) TaxID=1283841 RepID=A0A084QRK6_STAC4|nr:hypothetical protein S40285_10916 [Stachybotrys chlorohalonata IBT 40285]